MATWASWDAMIRRSSTTEKVIASSASVRIVATSVPTGTPSSVGWGADSQNVTSASAAVGGRRRTPISSRNFT
jgi:hypothetical protein